MPSLKMRSGVRLSPSGCRHRAKAIVPGSRYPELGTERQDGADLVGPDLAETAYFFRRKWSHALFTRPSTYSRSSSDNGEIQEVIMMAWSAGTRELFVRRS